MYADYTFYTDEFFGTAIEEADFPRLSSRASDFIDYYTRGKAAGVTDEEFGRSLAGESIEEATRAFLDELVDFFPGAKRLFLKKAVELSRKFGGEMTEALGKALEDPELERRVEESMRSSASSPASSE